MQFALVGNERTAPSPGLTGSCPVCSRAMVAKCGNQRIHHWAHRGKRVCDSWWEPETLWHRTWKSRYPVLWQETIQHGQNGEKHIADVLTEHGLTIEFQHSRLKPKDRAARESFYGSMVWVVDGSRLVRDMPRFIEGARSFCPFLRKGLYICSFPDEAFPRDWLSCTVPVFFDFENSTTFTYDAMRERRSLWCLLPGRVFGRAVVMEVSRNDLVRWTHSSATPIQSKAILEHAARVLVEQQRQVQVANLRATMLMRQGWRRQGSRRRYARF